MTGVQTCALPISAITESLCRTAALIAQDEALLSRLADETEAKIALGRGLDRRALGGLPAALGGRVVRKRLLALDGNAAEADIRRVLALATARTGTRIGLPGGFSAWTDARALHIGAYPEACAYEMPFSIEGETLTPRGRLVSGRVAGWRKPESGYEAYLDLAKLPEGLVVRSRRDGDRFHPLGAPGGRKLSDVLTDRKIPRERRDMPLLCGGSEVYYAAGLGVSEHAKVTPETREILHIICDRGDRG